VRNQHEANVWVQFACAAMTRADTFDIERAAKSADYMLDEYRNRVAKIDTRPAPSPVKKPGAKP